MPIEIIKNRDLKTSEWSGGTTTELYIFPENGNYAERNFTFRVSSATVDVEESCFTSLVGIKRLIMPLDGVLELKHKNHHSCVLKKNDIDVFLGDWETSSKGKVTDFNLMLNGDLPASMMGINLYPKLSLKFDHEFKTSIVYLYKGKGVFTHSGCKMIISTGDVAIINHTDEETIFTNNSPDEICQLAIARVSADDYTV